MKKGSNIELFEETPIPKAVAKLAVPTIFSSLVMVLYNLADTYFVGMLNNPVENAAVTLAAPVLLAFNAINNLFGVGTSSMMSRALGRKEYETVYKSSAFGFYCSLFSGIIFSIVCTVFASPLLSVLGANEITAKATSQYMFWTVTCGAAPAITNVVMAYMVRSEGSSFHASLGTMCGCLLNIILDPIFILPQGLNMGASGAGLATFISNCVACIYFFVLLFIKRKSTFVCINPKKLCFNRRIIAGVCGVGIPASIQNLLNVTGLTILNNFTSEFGADAVAAMGISQKIGMVPLQIALGFSQGIMPLISYTYSSKNHRRMKDSILFAMKLMFPSLICVAIAYFIGSQSLIRAFMNNESIIEYGTHFLRAISIGLPLLCMDFLTVGVFQALGKGKSALTFALLRKIALEIPALFILNKIFPLYGLAYAQPFAELVLTIASIFMMRKIFKDCQGESKLKKIVY